MSAETRRASRERVPRAGLVRTARALVVVALAMGAAGCIVWMVAQAWLRIPEYAEACVLFNASRLRDGLPLYVDPRVGAAEYGAPPARYFVAYTPLHAAAIALLPRALALPLARLVSSAAWVGALAFHALRARRECRSRAWTAALFAASSLILVRWAGCAKGDSLALLCASIALARAIDRDRADVITGALFGLAFLVKPSVVGMGGGALAASLFWLRASGRRRSFEPVVPVGAAATVVGLFLCALHFASGGVAVDHLRAALGLSFRADLLVENLLLRGPLVAGPVTAAALVGWSARTSGGGRIALAALVASTVSAFLGMSKVGGSSAYLLEPVLASVVVLARVPASAAWRPAGGARLVVVVASVASLFVSLSSTARGWVEDVRVLPERGRALERARAECLVEAGSVVLSSDPGVELFLNGRIHTHAIEMENEVRRGRFPVAAWVGDVQDPAVRCVVSWAGGDVAPAAPAGPFPLPVAEALARRFALVRVDAGYAIYGGRAP